MEKINDFDIQIQSDEIASCKFDKEGSDWVNDWESNEDDEEFIDDWIIRAYRQVGYSHHPFKVEFGSSNLPTLTIKKNLTFQKIFDIIYIQKLNK